MSHGSEIRTNRSFSVNRITQEQVEHLVSIIRHNLDPFEEAGSVLAATYRRLSNFWTIYNSPGSAYWVVTIRETSEVIGGAGLGPFVGLSPKDKIGEIRELVIDGKYRGQGAGTLLLKTCLNFAKSEGYGRVYLETTPQMKTAQQLFKRFKFSPVTQQGETDDLFDNSLPCYFMLDNLQTF